MKLVFKMTNVYLIIVQIYLFCFLVTVQTQNNNTKTTDSDTDCPVKKSCNATATAIFAGINIARLFIYADKKYKLIWDDKLAESALKWAQTEPEKWDYDKRQCNNLQEGISYWKQINGEVYTNVSKEAVVTNLMTTHMPAYTCGVSTLFNRDQMKEVKYAGVGVWATKKNNTRGTGKVMGVQIWIFVHYSLPPSFVPPIMSTVTPPPDPDATTAPSTTAKPISTTTTVKPSSTTAPPSTTKPASTTTAKPTSKTTPKPTTTTTTTTKPTTKKSTSKPAPKTTPNPASKPTSPPKKTKKPHDQTAEPDTVLTETPEPVETTVLTTENPNDTSSEKIDPNQE